MFNNFFNFFRLCAGWKLFFLIMVIILMINMVQKQEVIEKHLPDTTLMINMELKQEVLKQIQMV